jgi:hypothetical protein
MAGNWNRNWHFDALLRVGVVAGDDGSRRLSCAQIYRLVRHIGRDEQKVARLVNQRLSQTLPVSGFHPSFQDVDCGFETLVEMGSAAAPGGMTTRFIEMPAAPAVAPPMPTK